MWLRRGAEDGDVHCFSLINTIFLIIKTVKSSRI
jgi:hypothetical protein